MGMLKYILAIMAIGAMAMAGSATVNAYISGSTSISFGETAYGYLDYDGDSDYYEFYASSGTSIVITLNDPTGADYDIYLYSNYQSGSHSDYLAAQTSTSDTTTLSYTITSSDYYYIEIFAYSYSTYYYSYSVSLNYDTYISVTNPDTSDTWYTGSSYYIEWSYSTGTSSYVTITIDSDPYSSYYATTIESTAYNDGSYYWTVPSSYSSGYYIIRVADYYYPTTYYDDSDSFYISGSNYISVTNPDSSDTWYTGSSYYIQWDYTTGISSYVTITIDSDPYSSYYATTIDSATSNDGSYYWTVPSSYSSGYYIIRVADYYYPSSYSDDSSSFYISGSNYISVTNPDSYDTWYTGSSYYIEWDYTAGISSYVTITIDSDPYSSGYATTIDSATSNDGSYYWTVPSSYSSGYYIIRVADYYYPSSYSDDSSSFYISGSDYISVTNPDSYDTWYTGSSYYIEWDYTAGTSSYVTITIDSDPYSSSYATTIESYTSNDGSYYWTIPSSYSSGYYIVRVADYSYSSYYDNSESFYIYGASSSTISVGSTTSGYLESSGTSDYYQIYLSSGENIVIELDCSGSDFDLDLYNENYGTVASSSAYGDDTITYFVPSSGYYYIQVSSYDGSGYYSLSTHYGSTDSSIPMFLIIVVIIIIVVIAVVIAAVAASKRKPDVPPPAQPDQVMFQQYDPTMGPQQGQVTFQQWPPPPGSQPPTP